MESDMRGQPESLLEPLSRFVLEVLPWALSGLIGLYLAWGFWSAPVAARAEFQPVAGLSAPALRSPAYPTVEPM
jgi:hypothetical protein